MQQPTVNTTRSTTPASISVRQSRECLSGHASPPRPRKHHRWTTSLPIDFRLCTSEAQLADVSSPLLPSQADGTKPQAICLTALGDLNVLEIEQLIQIHCPNGESLLVEVRPGRVKVTIGDKSRTVLTHKRKASYRNAFRAWVTRVCC